MKSIKNYKEIFILGIGGSGMSSIAKYLNQRGSIVKGYDQRSSYVTNLLENDGVTTAQDMSNEKYNEDVLYVVSSALKIEETFLKHYESKDNVMSRPTFLHLLSKEVEIIGITGSHGKTSTTALVAHIFHYNNVNVSYIYGGVSSYGNIGGHFGDENLPLVLETDEAFNTFEHIEIENLLVTNIDNDHLDYFGSFTNLVKAFTQVINKVKKTVVINYDDHNLKKIKNDNLITYGEHQEADIKISEPNTIIYKKSNHIVESVLLGKHYLSNIAGAIALCTLYELSITKIIEAISKFSGVKRRLEYIGNYKDVKFYDDYGHHPTEMKATISALKNNTPGKLFVIFQPHRFTRTRDNFEQLQESLGDADFAVVTDVYSAGEDPIPGISSKNFKGKNIKYIKSLRSVPIYIKDNIASGDSVLTLGAGDVTLLGPQILKYLND
jgi:UDP-N-acetylmuramate--alanine ligase